jgi:hypothetical protein
MGMGARKEWGRIPKCDVPSRRLPVTKEERGDLSPRPFPFPLPILPFSSRGEAPESTTDIALAQPLERAVAQLANALARDAEH